MSFFTYFGRKIINLAFRAFLAKACLSYIQRFISNTFRQAFKRIFRVSFFINCTRLTATKLSVELRLLRKAFYRFADMIS